MDTRNCLFSISLMAIMSLIAVLLLCMPAAGIELKRISVSDAAAEKDALIFIDARPVNVWKRGHIPKARSFSWEAYTFTDADGVKYRTDPPEKLARALGGMGIGNTDAIVVYGDADTSWGGEGWAAWVFARLGHQGPVYVLDGGISLWQSKGYPISTILKKDVRRKKYIIHLQSDQAISAADIAGAGNRITLVDTRNYLTEWLPGHIPGAIHISWKKFYHGPHRRFISANALKKLLIENGVDLNKPVVYYCTGGIRSGFAWMVHELAGIGEVKNFEGGMEAWHRLTRISQKVSDRTNTSLAFGPQSN